MTRLMKYQDYDVHDCLRLCFMYILCINQLIRLIRQNMFSDEIMQNRNYAIVKETYLVIFMTTDLFYP